MKEDNILIREAVAAEFNAIGRLMTNVYAQLEGFPKESEQPDYYTMLANVGLLTEKPSVSILVAIDREDIVAGAVVYFGDMAFYGSGGKATAEKNAAGFRLLAVTPAARGKGIGKKLTMSCIERARAAGHEQLIIHSTKFMETAWSMYLAMGFKRSEELDFQQGLLPVYGFRYRL